MKNAAPDLFLTGAGGFLGSRLRGHALAMGLSLASSRDGLGALDLETPREAARRFRATGARLIIHAAAIPDIASCAAEPERAWRVNRDASIELAEAAAEQGARYVFISTDQVFDGRAAPYDEDASPRPLHHYGATKAAAEEALLGRPAGRLLLRLPLMIGASAGPRRSASDVVLDAIRRHHAIGLFVDEYRSPAEVLDVAAAVLSLALGEDEGLLHLGGPERLSRWEIGQIVAAGAGFAGSRFLEKRRLQDHELAGSRPADLELDSRRAEARLGRRLLRLAEAIA